MTKYTASVSYWANVCVSFESKSCDRLDLANAAYDAASNTFSSLCHQCANEIEIGDPHDVVVSDEDENDIAAEGYLYDQDREIAALRQKIEDLENQIRDLME